MEKTRDLFKKIRDTKGIFHAKMGTIKERNSMNLTEAEDIKKTWPEYTGELLKKNHDNPDNHDGVITHLEPDILESKVKWALRIITTDKASGGDGILTEFFQVIKDDAMKVLHSICQQIWKSQQWIQDWKRVVFISFSFHKECSNHCTIALISHANKVMLKILQVSFNSRWTKNFQMFKLDLEKAEEPEVKLPTSVGLLKKQENSRKTSTSALLTTPNPLTAGITTNCRKFLKSWEHKTTLPASWEVFTQVKSNS